MSQFPVIRRLYVIGYLLAGSLALGGCALTDIFKSVKTDYGIQGPTDDAETAEYLQSILNERLAEKTKTLSDDDDPEQRERHENYIEETIRADLLKALHAKGYYNAQISFSKGTESLSGTYSVDYGDKFRISYFDIVPDIYKTHLKEDAWSTPISESTL